MKASQHLLYAHQEQDQALVFLSGLMAVCTIAKVGKRNVGIVVVTDSTVHILSNDIEIITPALPAIRLLNTVTGHVKSMA
jgi:hypothetical protein